MVDTVGRERQTVEAVTRQQGGIPLIMSSGSCWLLQCARSFVVPVVSVVPVVVAVFFWAQCEQC